MADRGGESVRAPGGNLTVEVGATDVTVAAVKMGGTSGAVTTDIASAGGGVLVFESREVNDNDPGPPTLPIVYSYNQARGLIWSTGVAGSTNTISSNLRINDNVTIEGDRDLTISGDILEGGLVPGSTTDYVDSSLSSLSSGTVYIAGDIVTTEEDSVPGGEIQDRPFRLNLDAGLLLEPDPLPDPLPPDPLPWEVARQGTVDVVGHITGPGELRVGSRANNVLPISTVILRSDNSGFTGTFVMERMNLVLYHDNALGSGKLLTGTPSDNNAVGFNFISTDDARNISIPVDIAHWHTIKGGSDVPGLEAIGDHSIEFSGQVTQTNTRGWVNLLPAGKTLTVSGPQYPLYNPTGNSDQFRIYTIDGSGLTMITGGIHNHRPDSVNTGQGMFRKRGTGTTVIDFDEANTEDVVTDYGGHTFMEGGNLRFATNDDLPDPTGTLTRGDLGEIVSIGGAVGVDTGVVANATFLGMVNNSSNPSNSEHLTTDGWFDYLQGNRAIFNTYDHGGLMLATGEYGSNLDFNTGDLANAANMTLAPRPEGSTYTGTITPKTSLAVRANTYKLGGGTGVLTLGGTNQLTGVSNHLLVANGEVAITGTNDYQGVTTILAKATGSIEALAEANQVNIEGETAEGAFEGNNVFRRATLTVTNLANGGTNSSIGKSTSAASNLVIQGSTLKYNGTTTSSTDRLFTVGTRGAIIDASGDEPTDTLTFSNTGALAIDIAESRSGAANPSIGDNANNEIIGIPTFSTPFLFDTEDLVPGMVVHDVPTTGDPKLDDDDSPLVITEISSPHVIRIGETDTDPDNDTDPIGDPPNPWAGNTQAIFGTINFGPAPARMVTLTGSNTGDNTLNPIVGDASDRDETVWTGSGYTAVGGPGGMGSVGITKSGTGTWVLAAANTYTGQTLVNAGTLKVTGSTGTGDTIVADGAILKGSGNVAGNLIVNAGGSASPGLSPGTLTVAGTYTQEADGILDIEIASAVLFDLLDINGADPVDPDPPEPTLEAAELAGFLSVSLLGGYTPTIGTMFTVLTAASIGDNGLALSGPNAADFDLIINPTSVVLEFIGSVTPLFGDYNEDGVVNGADYTVWRDNMDNPSFDLPNEDATEGTVTEEDFAVWRAHFGETLPPGAGGGSLGGSGAVPEPASVVLALMALVGLLDLARRR